jgi:hypothetical protein
VRVKAADCRARSGTFILPALFVITLAPGVLSALHDLKMLGGGASSASSALSK